MAQIRKVKAPSEYLLVRFTDQNPTESRVCTACGHVGLPTRQMAGRADVELALWSILAGLAAIYMADFIVLEFTSFRLFRWIYKLTSMAGKVFVVLSIAYTLIRISIRTNVCPTCGGTEVIPLDSPRARQLLEKQGQGK
jgi:hypothetical protein